MNRLARRIFVLMAIVVLIGLSVTFAAEPTFAALIVDDFEEYTLGSLNGQGDWTKSDFGATSYQVVDNSNCFSGTQCIQGGTGQSSIHQVLSTSNPDVFEQNLMFRPEGTASSTLFAGGSTPDGNSGRVWSLNWDRTRSMFMVQGVGCMSQQLPWAEGRHPVGFWYNVQLRWDKPAETLTFSTQQQGTQVVHSYTATCSSAPGEVNYFHILADGVDTALIDTLDIHEPAVVPVGTLSDDFDSYPLGALDDQGRWFRSGFNGLLHHNNVVADSVCDGQCLGASELNEQAGNGYAVGDPDTWTQSWRIFKPESGNALTFTGTATTHGNNLRAWAFSVGNSFSFFSCQGGSVTSPFSTSDHPSGHWYDVAVVWTKSPATFLVKIRREGDATVYEVNPTCGLLTTPFNYQHALDFRFGPLVDDYVPYDFTNPPNEIIFSTTRDGNGEIYRMTSDGSGVTRITISSLSEFNARKSSDGSKIAFSWPFESTAHVYTIDADGLNRVQLTNAPGNEYVGGWSPDGSKIVFGGPGDGGKGAIFVMDPDGSDQIRLSINLDFPANPAWCFGDKIVFDVFVGDGNYEIYVIDADGSNLIRLTDTPTRDSGARCSPDGTKIAFDARRDGNPEIYTMNADGSNQVRLTNDLAADLEPVWSPDGTQIAFSTSRDGNSEIYVMDADGSNQTNITNNPASDTTPDWGPAAVSPLLNEKVEQQLVERFSPILYFHEDEKYRPQDIQVVLDTAVLFLGDEFIVGAPPPLNPALLAVFTETDFKLDLLGDIFIPNSPVTNEPYENTAYAHITEDENRIVLQYWLFYYFNDWQGAPLGIDGTHEGDWEFVQFIFPEHKTIEDIVEGDIAPKLAVYSAHLGGYQQDWDAVKKEDGRPVVYVTQGSHANHFEKGTCDITPPRGAGVDKAWSHNRLELNNSRPILDPVNGTEFEWLLFGGKWGQPGGPKSPLRQVADIFGVSKWDEPIAWSNITIPRTNVPIIAEWFTFYRDHCDGDGDGIWNNVDRQPDLFSNDFQGVSGVIRQTSGTISIRGDRDIKIKDAEVGGVHINVGFGAQLARIDFDQSLCFPLLPFATAIVLPPSIFFAGVVTCGSMDLSVEEGSAEFVAAVNEVEIVTIISEGQRVKYDLEDGRFIVQTSGEGEIILEINGKSTTVLAGNTIFVPVPSLSDPPSIGGETAFLAQSPDSQAGRIAVLVGVTVSVLLISVIWYTRRRRLLR